MGPVEHSGVRVIEGGEAGEGSEKDPGGEGEDPGARG